MASGKRSASPEKPRWPYFGVAQKRLLFSGFGLWIGTALPWLFLRPFGISRYASPLAASWMLWAGLMTLGGAVARWRTLALVSAALGGGAGLGLAGWQVIQIVTRCGLDSVVRLRCVPGPGLFIVTATSAFVLAQAWRLARLDRPKA